MLGVVREAFRSTGMAGECFGVSALELVGLGAWWVRGLAGQAPDLEQLRDQAWYVPV